jgi:hypothetical protein
MNRKRKEKCMWCGNKFNDEEVYYLIARIDPHSHLLRFRTDDEVENTPKNLQKAAKQGYTFAIACKSCHNEQVKVVGR